MPTYDAAIALVLVGAAIVFGVTGEAPALVLLLAAGIAQLLLNGFTRYSPVAHLRLLPNDTHHSSLERPPGLPPGAALFSGVRQSCAPGCRPRRRRRRPRSPPALRAPSSISGMNSFT